MHDRSSGTGGDRRSLRDGLRQRRHVDQLSTTNRKRSFTYEQEIKGALGIHDPLLLQEHPRPRTRREFVAQSFWTGAATVIAPTLAGHACLSARGARNAGLGYSKRGDRLQTLRPAPGKIPFICFDLQGGGNIAGSNVLVGGPKGQLDFLSVAGYSKLGLPGSMVPNASATGSFVDSSFGLRYHSDSAHLRGMKLRASAAAMAGTTGTIIPALSQNDTNTNPHNPMYGIYQFGARGGLLDLDRLEQLRIRRQFDGAADHGHRGGAAHRGRQFRRQQGSGQHRTAQHAVAQPADVTNVLESMKRVSDAKYSAPGRAGISQPMRR